MAPQARDVHLVTNLWLQHSTAQNIPRHDPDLVFWHSTADLMCW